MRLIVIGSSPPAVAAFEEMARKVLGDGWFVEHEDDHVSPLVLLGSDTDNETLQSLILAGVVPELELRAGTEDYRIVSARQGERSVLVLAGGRRRAVLYAVYAYFEHFCRCAYFWDGDVTPRMEALPMDGIDELKRFRFEYRMIRYFAHRSLRRFQAEHWGWEDWKREIDLLLKKRLNLFMLRTGQDDLFQKAFPDIVDYPPEDQREPGAIPLSYNDRTALISLRERGQLRKKVLAYAFEHDLMHPEDMGPFTHWYSPTPQDFLEKKKPRLLGQTGGSYQKNPRLAIWDCDVQENVDNYIHLTETHAREYGKPEIFHTIGLAERSYGTPEESYRLKSRTLRKFIARLRDKYPHAPLLVASWDFLSSWRPQEIRRYLAEFDWSNTILLDYTADCGFLSNNYLTWGIPRKYPWICGLFEGFEPNNDFYYDFSRAEQAFSQIQDDSACKGIALWPEMSHGNILLFEYFARKGMEEDFSLDAFCAARYGGCAELMAALFRKCWSLFAAGAWTYDAQRPFVGHSVFPLRTLDVLAAMLVDDPHLTGIVYGRRSSAVDIPAGAFADCVRILENSDSPFVRRDVTDVARTVLAECIYKARASFVLDYLNRKVPSGHRHARLIRLLGDLLETHEDFSLNDSLAALAGTGKVNPFAEEMLKGNAEVDYCRSYVYEVCRGIYEPEAEQLATWFEHPGTMPDRDGIADAKQRIRQAFHETALANYKPAANHRSKERLMDILNTLDKWTQQQE